MISAAASAALQWDKYMSSLVHAGLTCEQDMYDHGPYRACSQRQTAQEPPRQLSGDARMPALRLELPGDQAMKEPPSLGPESVWAPVRALAIL